MIERMEDLILAGISVPFTPWTVLNGDKLVPLLDRIRENLPDEIQQSQKVMDRREEILGDAQQRANQILHDSKKQAELMLSESELLRAVHAEADRVRQQITTELETMRKKAYEEAEAMKAQAYEESRLVREGADQYAETILGSLDKSVTEFQAVIRNGQKYLQRARAENAKQNPHALRPPGVSQQPAGPLSYNVSSGYGNPMPHQASPQGSPYATSGGAPTPSQAAEYYHRQSTGV